MAGFICLLATHCTNEDKKKPPPDGLNVSVVEPVERDYAAIKKGGRLRVITRYSSNTYFLNQGLQWGFEYELVKGFAEQNNLELEMIVVKPGQNPYDLLNSGAGDVIAANYTITPARRRYVDFTHPYNLVNQTLVFSERLQPVPDSLQQVSRRNIPITVRRNSSYYHRLQHIVQQGVAININPVSNSKDTEALLVDVARGQHIATVADDNIFDATSKYMQGLVKGPVIARNDTIAWAIRKNAPQLKKRMNSFLSRHFRLKDSTVKRSEFLNVLRRRYFEGGNQVAQYYTPESLSAQTGVISPYDNLFKKVADSSNVSWLMLAAIAAQETKFKPDAKSWTGAVGLMQVLPRYSQVTDSTTLADPETNIREGLRIFESHMNHYAYMDSTNQWRFALAAYNAGQGHIADARRLAIDFNQNPNDWSNTADALLKLMNRQYYSNARHGFCRGIETVNYVQDIMNRYQNYKSIRAMAAGNADRAWPGVFGIFQ